ncbi:MAG: hypothetical protein JWP38_3748 [Herbaspirillum sp.]|nr:hypothetical protein [Herbaspirillum sp.]
MSSFTKKRLDLTITLGTGSFGETVGSTVKLSGLRMIADIAFAGGATMGALQMRVFGLPQAMMNQLTTIGLVATDLLGKNAVTLAAGDDVNGMRMVYQGSITSAWADYSSAPDVAFNIIAAAGMDAALRPVPPVSFNSPSVDVSSIMSQFATTMGYAFKDLGVSAKLSYPYFDGTALSQARSCANAADIWMTIDRGALVIWPKSGAVMGDIPLISPATGLVGYPSPSSGRISFTTVFNQDIYMPGKVQLESSIPMGRGVFITFKVSHSLSSELPGGPWFTTVECAPDAR